MSNPGGADIVGYWKLDEVSGERADSHVNGLDLTDASAVGYGTGKIGNAALFVKISNDRLYRAYESIVNPTGSFSWIAWLNLNSLSGNMEIIATRASAANNYTIYFGGSTGKLRVSHTVGGVSKTVESNSYGMAPNEEWIMLYGEFEVNDHVGISINDGTLDTASFTGTWDLAEIPLTFGANPSGYNYLDGLIDEAVMFDRLLTPAEVTWMYNSGSGRTYSDLTSETLSADGIETSPAFGTPTVGVPGTDDLVANNLVTESISLPTPGLVHSPERTYPYIGQPPEGDTPVYILDPSSMNVIGMIEDYYSLIWTERYNEVGEFELEVPIEYDNNSLVDFGNLLYIRESDRIMVIEDIKPSVSADKATLLLKGDSCETLLRRRVLLDAINVDGLSEAICYALIIDNMTDASDSDRNISIIKTTFPAITISTEFKDQLVMQSIYNAVQLICQTSFLGFKFSIDSGKLAFSVYEGTDRSFDQSENTYIIFSDNFDNVVSSSFYLSEKEKINAVLVASKIIDQYGNEEYAPSLDRVFVWSGSEPSDINRFETIVQTEIKRTIKPNPPPAVEIPKIPDQPVLGVIGKHLLTAISISTSPVLGVNTSEPVPPPPPPETPLTDNEVASIINTKGMEILDTWKAVGLFEGDFDIHGNFKYGIDFYMGDIVQCNLEGRNVKARIIELVRSYSVEGLKTYVAFDFII